MMRPVTAITIFLPMVDAQKLGARLSRGAATDVLIFFLPQEEPEVILAQLSIIRAEENDRQGYGIQPIWLQGDWLAYL